MKRTLSWCLASALVAFGGGFLCPSPLRRPSPPPATAEAAFADELSRLTSASARDLEAELDGRYDDAAECERIYRAWKYRRKAALDGLYSRHGRTPPD